MTSLEVGLLQEVGKNFHQIKDFSTAVTRNAVNTVTQTVDQAVNSVSETTHNAKASLTETAAKAINMFNEATSQTIDTVTKTAEQAQDKINQTAVSAIDNVTLTTKTTSTAIENSLNTFINKQLHGVRGWIDSYPVMSWATKVSIWGISHPILSIIIIISSIFILRQFIKALSQFLEQIFLHTLQAPFKFGQFILGWCLKPFGYLPLIGNTLKQSQGNMLVLNTSIPASVSQNNKERLAYILNRLEAIRQEQNQLLQEVTAILASNENSR